MTKYYLLDWPESQKWSDLWHEHNELDIRLLDNDAVAVECSLYDYYDETGEEPIVTKESILKKLSSAVSGTEKELYTEAELNKFAEFYVDKWDYYTSEDVIAESFVDFWDSTDKECRRCSFCGKLMTKGYYLSDEYACSDKCRNNIYIERYNLYTDAEAERKYLKDYEEANDYFYYTEWR